MNYDELEGLNNRSVNVNMCLPMTLLELIDRIAYSEDVKSAAVIRRLLRKGLAVERDERAAKAGQ